MNEKIMSIEEVTHHDIPNDWSCYDGYKIVTEEQEIFVLISDSQSCCENWGYFQSEDDLSPFIGAQLLDIRVTDGALKTASMAPQYSTIEDVYDGGIMFVTFETDKGTFQLVAYNSHNGYYGHAAKVISRDLKYEDYL